MKVTIVGQGYVGLPLSIAAAQAGYKVFGLDKDAKKIQMLGSGHTVIEDISNKELRAELKSGNYFPTSDFSVIKESKVVILCVPTPLANDRQPDLGVLEEALTTTAQYLTNGTLVIVESTIHPGASEDILIPLVKQSSQLEANQIQFAYSPERIDPTNNKWNIKNTPKLVAGNTPEASSKAMRFYGKFIEKIIRCESLKIAEMAKLLENTYRLVNISLINEIADYCEKININTVKVIEAASSKPYGFMPFYPGLGAGGHCIPVDPIYLMTAAQVMQSRIKLIEVAAEINQNRYKHFMDLATRRFGNLEDKRVLVVGVAYKSNVADVRETPVEALILALKEIGAKVSWHDDLVKEWNNEKSVAISNEFDLAIIATPHNYLDLTNLGSVPILNTRETIQ